jgi:hypothetical protein
MTALPTDRQDIRAIPTDFDGWSFRSKLEARFALFFKLLHLTYQYEPEPFELRTKSAIVRYTPDFYLPTLQSWVEIKGTKPSETEDEKANLLALASNQPVYVFFEDCWRPDDLWASGSDGAYGYLVKQTKYGKDVFWEPKCCFVQCPKCLKIQLATQASLPTCTTDQTGMSAVTDNLIAAYLETRRYQFWKPAKKSTPVPTQLPIGSADPELMFDVTALANPVTGDLVPGFPLPT